MLFIYCKKFNLKFLSNRKQRFLLEGKSSAQADVTSGVPQGTVNGPLYFLAFINDLPECISSDCGLFADDSFVYRLVRSDKDAEALQKDLNSLEKWEEQWQMKFHPEKCQVINICTNPKNRKQRNYTLHGHTLETVDHAKYLGVHLNKDMSWNTHASKTAAKASSTLCFLRRNLRNCTKEVRERTFQTFVTPTLNYAAAAWDPYQAGDIDALDKVQRRGARYVTNNYHDKSPGCVTNMINSLGWLPLKEQRRAHRLKYLHKIKHQDVDIDPGHLLQSSDSRTRGRGRIKQQETKSTVYHQSFYPRTIREWNQLPTSITDIDAGEGFAAALDGLLRGGTFVFKE